MSMSKYLILKDGQMQMERRGAEEQELIPDP
jgi:hypothetical protein